MRKKIALLNFLFTLVWASSLAAIAQNQYSWQAEPPILWHELQQASLGKLQTELKTTTERSQIAWLKLAIIYKENWTSTKNLINHLIEWRTQYPEHPGNTLFADNANLIKLHESKPQEHIALLLPLHGPFSNEGKAVREGFLTAYYQALPDLQEPETLTFYDTSRANVTLLYERALADGASMIIGPLTKTEVKQLSAGKKFTVPILALNYSDEMQSAVNFYEYGLSSADEAEQAAEKAYTKGLSRALLITANDAWGQYTSSAFLKRWEALGGTLVARYDFSATAHFSNEIANLLDIDPVDDKPNHEIIRRQDFDVVFLFADAVHAHMIVPLLKYYAVNKIPIYATSAIHANDLGFKNENDLAGVYFPDIPWIFHKKINKTHLQYDRFYAVGLDAYLLSQELNRLIELPHFPIVAETGTLSLNQHSVYRELPWSQMHAKQS